MRVHKNKFENATRERMRKRGIKKKRREGANEKSSLSGFKNMAIVLNLVGNWKHEKFAS